MRSVISSALSGNPETWPLPANPAPAAQALRGEAGAAQRRAEREDDSVTIAEELAALGLFHGLDEAEIAALAEVCFVRRLARGQVLFVAGEPSEHLCVVRSGLLRVVTSSPHGDQFVLSNVAPGQALGELSILDGKPRSADVVAADPTELVVIPAVAVRALLDREPAALRAFAMELARSLRRLTGAMGDILFLDLPRRLAKALVAGAVAGRDGTYRVELAGSQSALAAELGVTRQSLNKALTGLARRGWIEVAGREVVLRDVAALARFVDS
jgi:CRP-like cAMP-binding protein